MTREEAYDFLVSLGYQEPAVVYFGGDKYVLGQWLPVAQIRGEYILQTRKEDGRAVKVLGEGTCWLTAMRATGHWQEYVAWKNQKAPVVTGIRQKTVKDE